MTLEACRECGAQLSAGRTCWDDFYQMLYWENERPALGEVHHLMVLCFYLQHPSQYSPEGLRHAFGLLGGFVEGGVSPAQARAAGGPGLDSGRRGWTVTARRGQCAAYPTPPRWAMTAKDVITGGADGYVENVGKWARAVWEAVG